MFEATEISLETLLPTVHEMSGSGWRLVTQSAVDCGEDGWELLYHFDREEEMRHFRLKISKGTVIPSISHEYFAALLIENENQDLFGLKYEGLVLDFDRTLYLEDAGSPISAPFCKISTFKKAKSEG